VLLHLRASRAIGVDNARRLKLKATHDKSHSEAEKGTSPRDKADFSPHHHQIGRQKLLCEGTIHVELWVEINFSILMK